MCELTKLTPANSSNDILIKLSRNDLLRLSRQILIDENLVDEQIEAWASSFECFRMAILGQLQHLIWYPNEIHSYVALSPYQMSMLCRVLDKYKTGYS